jgi:ParB family chromosome partitioning protein
MTVAIPRDQETYGGLLTPGETPAEAIGRLERRADYAGVIGTDDGQRLLAAASVRAPSKGRKNGQPKVVDLSPEASAVAADVVQVEMPADLAVSIGEVREAADHAPHFVLIKLDRIDIGDNVRHDPGELEQLAASIKEHGVLQPVKVVGIGDRWRLVWGQRRVLAARMAGLERIPAINAGGPLWGEQDLGEQGAKRSIEQLIENIQRADLNAIDRARAMKATGLPVGELAKKLGIDHSTVSNSLGLLELAEPVQELVGEGRLTASHAKVLKGLAPKTQAELARTAAKDDLSSHWIEQEVQRRKREEAWRKEREEAERKTAAARLDTALSRVEKAKVAKDARIVVAGGYSYGAADGLVGHVVDELKKAGYTNVGKASRDVESRTGTIGCDCALWLVTVQTYGTPSCVKACEKRAHREARLKADEAKRTAKYELEHRVRDRLSTVVPDALAADPVPTQVARIMLWIALDYAVADFAEKRGGKRTRPWETIGVLEGEELQRELGKAIASKFRDQFGYHLPWDAIAAELGLDDASKAVEP